MDEERIIDEIGVTCWYGPEKGDVGVLGLLEGTDPTTAIPGT